MTFGTVAVLVVVWLSGVALGFVLGIVGLLYAARAEAENASPPENELCEHDRAFVRLFLDEEQKRINGNEGFE